MGALTMAFAPLFTSLRDRKETELLHQWVRRLLCCQTAGAVAALFGVLLLGDRLVPLVLGTAYRPMVSNLVPLTGTLIVPSRTNVAGIILLSHDRPGVAVGAATIRLIVFWGLGPIFVARWSSRGAALAVLAASAIHAAYLVWSMQPAMRPFLGSWATITGLGAIFLPLVLVRPSSSLDVNVMLYLVFLFGYAAVLGISRMLTLTEVTALWRAISCSKRGPARVRPEIQVR